MHVASTAESTRHENTIGGLEGIGGFCVETSDVTKVRKCETVQRASSGPSNSEKRNDRVFWSLQQKNPGCGSVGDRWWRREWRPTGDPWSILFLV